MPEIDYTTLISYQLVPELILERKDTSSHWSNWTGYLELIWIHYFWYRFRFNHPPCPGITYHTCVFATMIAEPQRRRSTAHFKATLIHRKAQKQTSTAAQLRILMNERFKDFGPILWLRWRDVWFLTSHSWWFVCIWIIRSWHTTVGVRNTCWHADSIIGVSFSEPKSYISYFLMGSKFYLLVDHFVPSVGDEQRRSL